MDEHTIRNGHNEIVVKAGSEYRLTFDADTKVALNQKDAEIEWLQGVLISCFLRDVRFKEQLLRFGVDPEIVRQAIEATLEGEEKA